MDIPDVPESLSGAARQESREQLLGRVAELTEAVAARDAFIAVVGHELRNPITPILGQIELLVGDVRAGNRSAEALERRLARVEATLGYFLKRTAVLLDVSRLSTGKFRPDPEPCDLSVLARNAVSGLAETARQGGVPIGIEAPASLPGTWDRMAVEQIIDNLLSNAIKYGAQGVVEVAAEDAGERVRVRVRDHGPGIPRSHRSRVFERFERAVGPGGPGGGFGVGLWVVGQLVEGMNGAIAIEDAPGGGALFTVTLPRHVGAPVV